MTEIQQAIFRALDFALAVDGKGIVGIEPKKPPSRLADRESGWGLERMDTRLRLHNITTGG